MDKSRRELSLDSNGIDKLLLILKGRKPRSCLLYNVTKLQRNKKYSKEVKIKFYSEGDSIQDILILAVMTFSYFNENIVFISSPEDDIPVRFADMIENTIDWNIPHTFGDLSVLQVPLIHEMCRKNGNPVDKHEYFYYYMDINEGKELLLDQVPDMLKVEQLGVINAKRVAEKWAVVAVPELVLPVVRDSIETIAGIGVFEVGSKDDDGLVSWLIISPVGSFNALHTEEKVRRNGYGKIALKSMVQFATEKLDIFPVCHVEMKNIVSKCLMEKVGFKQGENIYWLDYKLRSPVQ